MHNMHFQKDCNMATTENAVVNYGQAYNPYALPGGNGAPLPPGSALGKQVDSHENKKHYMQICFWLHWLGRT